MGSLATLFQDWSRSFSLHALWTNLALEDLRDRYRRTALGLAWIVFSFAPCGGSGSIRNVNLYALFVEVAEGAFSENDLDPPNIPVNPPVRRVCESTRNTPLVTTLSPTLMPSVTG